MKYLEKLIYLRDKIQNNGTRNESETHVAIMQGDVHQNEFVKDLINTLKKVTTLVIYTTDAKSDMFVQAYSESLDIRVRMLRPTVKDGVLFDELLDKCDVIFADIRRLNTPLLMEPIYYRMTDVREEVIPLEVGGRVSEDDEVFYNKMLNFGERLSNGEIEIKDKRLPNPLKVYARKVNEKINTDPLK